METFVGIDVGTSSIKVVAIEVAGKEIRVAAEVNECYNEEAKPSRDPVQWVEKARRALAVLDIPDVAGIGFTGQMHSLVALSSDRKVLSPTLLWLDLDGDEDLQRFLKNYPEGLVEKTGNIPLPDFTLAKWLYGCRINPSLASRTAYILPAKDYVRWSLFPQTTAVTDDSEAVGTQLFHPFRRIWDEDLARRARVPTAALPRVVDPKFVVGKAGSLISTWKDTVLVVGAGDQAAAARAVGAHAEGTASVSLGTSCGLSVPWRLCGLPQSWDGALHLIPGTESEIFDVIATIPAFGPTLTWLAQLFDVGLVEIDQTLARTQIRAAGSGPHFFPYLEGSGAPHPDGSKRAVLSNLSLDVRREDLFRTVYDGLAMELASLVGEVQVWGVTVNEIVFSGGASRLPQLAATLASFLKVPCYRSEYPAASAIGAALLAHDALHPDSKPILPREALIVDRHRAVPSAWSLERKTILSLQKGKQR